jgi:predicted kinase
MPTNSDRLHLILDTLELPAPGPSPALLLVLSGLPASGKSTLAAGLAARHPFCVVATDPIRKALFPHRTYTGEESAATHRVVHDVLRDLLERGIWCVFDGTNLQRSHRETALALGEAAGARAVGLQLAVSLELVRARLRGLTAERAGSEAGMEVYDLLLAEFEPEPDDARGVIPAGVDMAEAIRRAEEIAGLAGETG